MVTREELIQCGFEWPDEIIISDPSGLPKKIKPYALPSAKDIEGHVHDRSGEALREYSIFDSPESTLPSSRTETELQIKTFICGGNNEVLRFNREIFQLFKRQGTRVLPRNTVDDAMRRLNFYDAQITICIGWLEKEGYIGIDSDSHSQLIKLIKPA